MKLTWQKIREDKLEDKLEELHKEERKQADRIANFDIEKRVQTLMRKVDKKPPGTFEYGLFDLLTFWERLSYHPHFCPEPADWCRDEGVKAWVFEEILSNLEENGIKYERVEGYYRFEITMP